METAIQEYDFMEKVRQEGFGDQFLNFLNHKAERKFKLLRGVLLDKQYKNVPLSNLCQASGVDYIDLERTWIDYNRQKGLVRMATQLPEVMEDVVVDSRSIVSTCRNCQGLGKMEDKPDFPICPICEGSGKVRKIGDKHSRELLFETMKLTQKEAAVQVNTTFSLENIVSDASKILRNATTIDVEPQ